MTLTPEFVGRLTQSVFARLKARSIAWYVSFGTLYVEFGIGVTFSTLNSASIVLYFTTVSVSKGVKEQVIFGKNTPFMASLVFA